jgi:DNA-binding response OmpR family regulator
VLPHPESGTGRRPMLLIAHSDPQYAGAVWRAFRREGWRVRMLRNGNDLRRLARLRPPAAAVLEADLAGESGWLTCAKLQWEQPHLPVYLVANQTPGEKKRFAQFVGARKLLSRGMGAGALLDELLGAAHAT